MKKGASRIQIALVLQVHLETFTIIYNWEITKQNNVWKVCDVFLSVDGTLVVPDAWQ